jgi:2,3-bisphosphoglycerate-dependent phosphoglycerate mutase
MAYLVLVRHGKSEWNKLGKWTGRTDVGLVQEGIEEARRAAGAIRDIPIDCAFISSLRRTKETFAEICGVLGAQDVEATVSPSLNERDYGAYTGKNKWDVKEEIGEESFQKLRRGWDVPIPEGESLKDVSARVVPYYREHILPEIAAGKNVLVVAHGNSLRALVKYLEDIPDDKIADIEIGTGEVHCYEMDAEGNIVSKTVRATNHGTPIV